MTHGVDRFFVITGGPGSGKSALMAALERTGFRCSAEAGRAIIRQQAHRAMAAQPGVAFFDRGVPEAIGYLRLLDLPVPAHMAKAVELFRYDRRVFICPPWPEIFAQDEERRQTPEEAERTFRAMLRTYAECGYDLVEVPRAPVPDRLAFVLRSAGLRRGNGVVG